MRKLGKIVWSNIVVGLMLVAPIAITAFIVQFVIKLVANNTLTKLIASALYHLYPDPYKAAATKFMLTQAVAIVLFLLVLFLIGFFVRSYFGRRLYRLAERILVRIPVFNKIYIQVRHISETIFSQRQTMFKEVVLLEYPRKGVNSVGFVTSSVPPSFKPNFTEWVEPDRQLIAIFIPTTPNPTSGMLIFVPRSDCSVLPISVSEAMQLVISAGAVYPGESELSDRPTLLDKLEQWITRETNLEPPTIEPTENKQNDAN